MKKLVKAKRIITKNLAQMRNMQMHRDTSIYLTALHQQTQGFGTQAVPAIAEAENWLKREANRLRLESARIW